MNGNVWELPVAKFEQVSLPERPVGQRFSISSLSFKSVRATIVLHLCWCGGSGGLFGRLGCVSSCVWLSVFGWGKSMNWIVRLFPVTKFVRVSSPEWLLRKGFQFHTGFHKSVQQQRNFVDDVERVACFIRRVNGWVHVFDCLFRSERSTNWSVRLFPVAKFEVYHCQSGHWGKIFNFIKSVKQECKFVDVQIVVYGCAGGLWNMK